jgi:prepilin-type processing-associated H-X9-DG protein
MGVFYCPSVSRKLTIGHGYGYGYTHYGFNRNLAYASESPMAKWKNPADTFMLADASIPGEGQLIQTNCAMVKVTPAADNKSAFSPRHSDGLNISFCDGHVKWLPMSQLPGLSTAYKFWYPSSGTM